VKNIPEFLVTYKINRETNTAEFLSNWFETNDQKQCVLETTDGSGNILEQRDLGYCELASYNKVAFDSAAPPFAQVQSMLVPESYDKIV